MVYVDILYAYVYMYIVNCIVFHNQFPSHQQVLESDGCELPPN